MTGLSAQFTPTLRPAQDSRTGQNVSISGRTTKSGFCLLVLIFSFDKKNINVNPDTQEKKIVFLDYLKGKYHICKRKSSIRNCFEKNKTSEEIYTLCTRN